MVFVLFLFCMKKNIKSQVVVYQAKNGAIELRGDTERKTIWATLDQIAEVFGRDKSVISRHLKHIYKEGELNVKATVAKNATVQMEGGRRVERVIEYYNLDAIISVGYRVNSKTATKFRQWATVTLHQYITQGYVVNKNRIAKNYAQFLEAVENIKNLLPAGSNVDHASVLELVSAFADTWLSLDAYDKETLVVSGTSKKSVSITSGQLTKALADFKNELLKKNGATEIFGQERQSHVVEGIVGNVMQSFGGKPLYGTVEEKAAHLLYFMVKNHPFVDGNKRSGAYAFVWFLKKAGALDMKKITPPTLTALTLLIAESDPKHKEKMVRLVLQLLKK